MGWIKNNLQTKMAQRRRNMLSVPASELDFVKELHFDDLVDEFVRWKADASGKNTSCVSQKLIKHS